MTEKKFNFDLGNRRLTANESRAVENAKRIFRESLQRHQGQTVAGHAVFKATSSGSAVGTVTRGTVVLASDQAPAPQRGKEATREGIEDLRSNKVAPAHRKY